MSPPTTRGTGWRSTTCIWPRPFRERASARAVLRQIVAQAMKENKTPYLYVFIRNEGAVRLYRRLGFAVVQEIPNSRYIMEYRG